MEERVRKTGTYAMAYHLLLIQKDPVGEVAGLCTVTDPRRTQRPAFRMHPPPWAWLVPSVSWLRERSTDSGGRKRCDL